MHTKQVIIVTDGDSVAKKAVETATTNIGARCISFSAGNPTLLSGEQLVDLITTAQHDPVVVMVDDGGDKSIGKGEQALETIIKNENVKVIGIIAASSNDKESYSVNVDFSIDKEGNKIYNAVDKHGDAIDTEQISGDTLSILGKFRHQIPVVIGLGDPGKMKKNDDEKKGAPITTLALKEILKYK